MFFNEYPYLDFHELNLDMIIRMMKELHKEWTDFEAVNKITNAGTWDITKQYQEWTVVSDNNVGYISLKPVPVGVAITNTEYWGVIADYDILITDLSNRISALENSVNITIPAQLSAINLRIDNIINKRVIFVCDSYGQTTLASGTAYPYLIGAIFGWTLGTDYYVSAIGGASWKGIGGRASFKDVLEAIEDNVTDKNTIDYIIVCGGVNDSIGTISNIYEGAQDFMTYVSATYPSAKVYAGMIGWNTDASTMNLIKTVSYPGYSNLGAYGIGVMANCESLMHDYRFFIADGTHPTQNGNYYIAYGIASFLTSGNVVANGYGTVTTALTLNASKFQSGNLTFKEFKTNNGVHVQWNAADLMLASGQTLDFEEFVTLGTKESIYWKASSDVDSACIHTPARLAWSDGDGYHSEPIMISIYNDDGTIKARIIASKQFDDIPNLVYLSITAGSRTFLTIEA